VSEGLCSVEHHEEDVQCGSSVTTDIKNEVFLLYLSPASIWHFPGSIVCLDSTIDIFMKKTCVCKPGFVNYGKPTAGGSHRLGSCWNYQLQVDKHSLLWEPHNMSVLCEMSFPRHPSVSTITWTLLWAELAFHIRKQFLQLGERCY